MSTVQMTFLANGESAERVIAQLEKKLAGLEERVKRGTGSGNVAGGIAQAFENAALSIGSLHSAMALLKGEFDDLIRRQDAALRTNRSYAGSFRQAFFNLGSDATIRTADDLQQEINRVSESTGSTPKAVADALGSSLSARGNLSAKDAVDATEAALKLAPNIPEAQMPLAGMALDFRKLNPNASAQSILGFGLQIGTESRVTDITSLAQNVAPAVASVMRSGAEDRSAGALTASLSQGMFDTEGQMSGTAAISLAAQLKESFPDLKSFEERLTLVQENEQARNAFLKGGVFNGRKMNAASFERKAETSIESLLTGGEVAAMYEGARARLPGLAGNERRFQEVIGDVGKQSSQIADLSVKKAEAGKERAQLENTAQTEAGTASKSLDEAFEAVGAGALDRFFRKGYYYVRVGVGQSPGEAGAAELSTYKKALESNPFGGQNPDSQASKKLDEMIGLLQSVDRNFAELNANSRKKPAPRAKEE